MLSHSQDFEDSLLDHLAEESGEPQRVVLASVHRPTFSQQLTVLRDQMPGVSLRAPVALASVFGRRSGVRAVG